MQKIKGYILPYLFVSTLGVLLHFTYGWSGNNPLVGYFSAVNESTWEHLKLIFFPMLALTIIQLFLRPSGGKVLLGARTIGTISGMMFIVIFFYTFWGVSGSLIGIVNVATYFLGVFYAFWTENKVLKDNRFLNTSFCILLWIVLATMFVVFSYHAPNLGIFYDLQTHPKILPPN